MPIDFKKFQDMYPADKIKKQMEEAAENGGGDRELSEGEYTTELEKLELGESKKGQLMLKAQFRIIKGEFKKFCVFKNIVLTGTKNDGFMLHKANEFLRSLDSGVDVEFEGWEDYSYLIEDVFAAIKEDALKYVLDVKKNGQYDEIEIIDILD